MRRVPTQRAQDGQLRAEGASEEVARLQRWLKSDTTVSTRDSVAVLFRPRRVWPFTQRAHFCKWPSTVCWAAVGQVRSRTRCSGDPCSGGTFLATPATCKLHSLAHVNPTLCLSAILHALGLEHARRQVAAIVRPCCPRSRLCCWHPTLTWPPRVITTPLLSTSTRATPAESHAVIASRDVVSHDRPRDGPTPSMSTPLSTTMSMTQSCYSGLRQ